MTEVLEKHEQLTTTVDLALESLAGEVELAGARCIYLDSLIGGLMPELPPAAQLRLQEGLQAVDLLSQHLTGISAFARRLSADAASPFEIPVEGALQTITLGALADRLTTTFGGAGADIDDGADSGDLDLF